MKVLGTFNKTSPSFLFALFLQILQKSFSLHFRIGSVTDANRREPWTRSWSPLVANFRFEKLLARDAILFL